MFKYFLVVLVVFFGSFNVYAQNAKNDSNANEHATEKKEICTKKDMQQIRRFHPIAKEKVEEFRELEKKGYKVDSKNEAERYTKSLKETKSFFESEEYMEMKIIYERCDQKIPTIDHEVPWWHSPKYND